MKIKNIVTVSEDLTHMLRRFPLAVLMVVLLTLGVLMLVRDIYGNDLIHAVRYMGGPILAGYVSVILYLIGEGRGRPVPALIHIAILIAVLAAVWFHEALRFNVWMAIGAAVLYLGSAPFRKKAQDNDSTWDFTHRIWVGAVFATVGSILFALGVLFIHEAVRALFDVRLNTLLYDWVLPIGLAGLAPLYWLSTIDDPNSLSSEDSLRQPGFISRAVGFMGVWLLAPLVLVFAAILLAYLVQIIVRGEIPNGETAQLVTPFLIIGTLTWLVLDPVFIRKKRIAKIFRSVWFWVMIPAASLLAISVFIRVKDFGLTPPRYLLALCVLWAVLISLWAIFRKKANRDLRTIPSLAAMLLALGSIGPLGAHGLSVINQKARVNSVIKTADIMTEQGVFKPYADMPELTPEQIRIIGGLNYLYANDERVWVKSKFASDDDLFTNKDGSDISNRMARGVINSQFRLKGHLSSNYPVSIKPLRLTIKSPNETIALNGYDAFIGSFNSTYRISKFAENQSHVIPSVSGSPYTVAIEGLTLMIFDDDVEIGRLNLAKTFKITDKPHTTIDQLKASPYPVAMSPNAEVQIGIVFTQFAYNQYKLGQASDQNKPTVHRVNLMLFSNSMPLPSEN